MRTTPSRLDAARVAERAPHLGASRHTVHLDVDWPEIPHQGLARQRKENMALDFLHQVRQTGKYRLKTGELRGMTIRHLMREGSVTIPDWEATKAGLLNKNPEVDLLNAERTYNWCLKRRSDALHTIHEAKQVFDHGTTLFTLDELVDDKAGPSYLQKAFEHGSMHVQNLRNNCTNTTLRIIKSTVGDENGITNEDFNSDPTAFRRHMQLLDLVCTVSGLDPALARDYGATRQSYMRHTSFAMRRKRMISPEPEVQT